MRDDRKRIWIDHFQTRLLRRILVGVAVYFVCLGNLMFIWRLLAEGPGNPLVQYFSSFWDYGPALVCLSVLMPVLAWDVIRFSHRVVGPVVRFRQTLQDIAAGKPVRYIKLREDDFLGELRDDFNKMLDALQRQGLPVLKPAAAPPEVERQPA